MSQLLLDTAPNFRRAGYGWLGGGACCSTMVGTAPNALQCGAEQCPLMLKAARLPANPFMAKITAAGKCECMPPQKCDA